MQEKTRTSLLLVLVIESDTVEPAIFETMVRSTLRLARSTVVDHVVDFTGLSQTAHQMVREIIIASRSAAMDVGVVRVSKAAIREIVVARRQTLMMSIPRMDTSEAMKSLRLGIGVPMVEMSILFSFLCARPRMPPGKT